MCLYWDFVYVLDHKEIKDLKAFMQIVIIIIIFFIIYLFFCPKLKHTPEIPVTTESMFLCLLCYKQIFPTVPSPPSL